MSYEIPGHSFTLVAGADLSASRSRLVNINSSGLAVAAGDGTRTIGVVQNNPTSGQAATIVIDGIVMVECGGTVTRGGNVTSDSVGRVVNIASGKMKAGVALETGASGTFIPVLLSSTGYAPA